MTATSAVVAFVLVGLAELGDKSQLLLLGFATKYKPLKVALGAALAIALLQLIAVAVGSAVGALMDSTAVSVIAGLVFVVFGVLTWFNASSGTSGDSEKPAVAKQPMRLGPVLTVACVFLLVEFGDKTQIMTVSIAADPAAALRTLGWITPALAVPSLGFMTSVGVWLGSSLGMLLADSIAIVIGSFLGARLPKRMIGRVSAVVFALFGVLTLFSALVSGQA